MLVSSGDGGGFTVSLEWGRWAQPFHLRPQGVNTSIHGQAELKWNHFFGAEW